MIAIDKLLEAYAAHHKQKVADDDDDAYMETQHELSVCLDMAVPEIHALLARLKAAEEVVDAADGMLVNTAVRYAKDYRSKYPNEGAPL